jgi:hypothetical protein
LLLLRERLRKLRWSLSLRCRRVGTRSRGIVKHLGGRRKASVSWWGWTLRLVLVLSRLLLGRGRLTRRHVLCKTISRVVGVQHLGLSTRVLRVLEVGKTVVTRPVCAWKRLLRLSLAWGRSAPLRSRRTSTQSTWLISLRRHVLRKRCASLVGQTVGRLTLEQRETGFDVHVGWVKLGSSGVSIQSVVGLVVARLIQSTEIVPDLGDVGVEADGPRVSIQSIAILVDLIVQHTDGAPEGRVATITVDGLLVGLIGLGILLLRHVAATEEVPALRISLVRVDRLFEVFYCLLLAAEAGALLMVQPSELLQNLGVVGIAVEDTHVSAFGRVILRVESVMMRKDTDEG